jgi:two-component system, cell cycle sensor histidine kinase and response regulator CckA
MQHPASGSDLILEAVPLVVVALNVAGKITYANARACLVLERPANQLIDKNWFDLCIAEETREAERRKFELWLLTPRSPEFFTELQVNTARSGLQMLMWHQIGMRNEMAELTGVLGLGLELTVARKLAESSLLATREWEHTFNAVKDAIWVLDKEARILRCNRASLEVFGSEVPQVIGRRCWELVHKSPVPIADCPFPRMQVTGARETLELRVGDRWMEVSVDPCFNATGELEGAVHIIRDITERRHAEEALRRSESLYRLLTECALDLISRHSPNGTVLYASPASRKILGYAPEELVGHRAREFVHPDDDARLWTLIQTTSKEGKEAYCAQHRMKHRDGGWIWVETNGRLLYQAPGVLREILCIVRDITERQHAEIQRIEMERRLLALRNMESLGALAGGIAHDFNNLLLAITGNLELLRKDLVLDTSAQARLDDAMLAAQRAATLTSRMLAYSGRSHFVSDRIALNDLVLAQLPLFQNSLGPGIKLRLELAPDLPLIEADEGQIQQAVSNLLTNALEAIGDQPGLITVRTNTQHYDIASLSSSRIETKPIPGKFVSFEVSDTGCGMSEAIQQRLFDPFFTTKFPGRGLGMSAVLGIVRGHHGAIFVDSASGQGACVRLLFPLASEAALSGSLGREAFPPKPRTSLVHKTILLADDEPLVLKACSHVLGRLGLGVITAATGLEAVKQFKQRTAEIDCALLDLSMPELDGLDAFRQIHEVRPELPVIIASGYDRQSAPTRLEAEGLAGFIHKPYGMDDLRVLLSRILAIPL